MELLDFYKGKRVLVTGDTGFKGSWLVLHPPSGGGGGDRLRAESADRAVDV